MGEKVERYLQLGEIETTRRERCRDLHQRHSGRRPGFRWAERRAAFSFPRKRRNFFETCAFVCVLKNIWGKKYSMRGQLDRTKHTRAHTKKKRKKKKKNQKTRRRRMRFYAAEERERQKREELSTIGALPITPQKKGKKLVSFLENTRKASIAFSFFSLSRYTHIE